MPARSQSFHLLCQVEDLIFSWTMYFDINTCDWEEQLHLCQGCQMMRRVQQRRNMTDETAQFWIPPNECARTQKYEGTAYGHAPHCPASLPVLGERVACTFCPLGKGENSAAMAAVIEWRCGQHKHDTESRVNYLLPPGFHASRACGSQDNP